MAVAKGMKVDARIKPQNTKNLLGVLSAKNPKTGCSIFEQIWVIATKTVASAIVNPKFAAIKGIIGFKNPPYMSRTR